MGIVKGRNVPLCCAAALLSSFVGTANAQTEKTFPAENEINIVLGQIERAMQQYKPLIDEEENQLGKSAADAVDNDRQVVNALETAVKALKAKPNGFNGPLGLILLRSLSDADHNALLCATGASMETSVQITAGNLDKAGSLLHLAQSCAYASNLIYTVGENAGTLFQKYIEAEQQLAVQGAEVADKCMVILKNLKTKSNRPER